TLSRRKMDSHYAPLDHGRVVLSGDRRAARRALGLRGAWLGRLLGVGSGRKRGAAALDYGHGVPAFGDDAGEARDDEGLERVAGLRDVHAVHPGDVADANWDCQLGARV